LRGRQLSECDDEDGRLRAEWLDYYRDHPMPQDEDDRCGGVVIEGERQCDTPNPEPDPEPDPCTIASCPCVGPGTIKVFVYEVLDETNTPIEGANVYIEVAQEHGQEVYSGGTTDANGLYETTVEPGDYVIHISLQEHDVNYINPYPSSGYRIHIADCETDQRIFYMRREMERVVLQKVYLNYQYHGHDEQPGGPPHYFTPFEYRNVRTTWGEVRQGATRTIRRTRISRNNLPIELTLETLGGWINCDRLDVFGEQDDYQYDPASTPASAPRFVIPDSAQSIIDLHNSGTPEEPPDL
jgi:hypothetical protein